MTAPARPTSPPRQSLIARANAALRKVVSGDKAPAPLYPTSVFVDWGYAEANDALDAAIEESELDATRAMRDATVTPIPDQAIYQDPRALVSPLTVNRAFFEGDHWQMGSGWIGPHPQQGDPDYVTAMNELVAAFTSKNVIREVTKRHASGVVGKPASWSFVPRRALAEGEEPNDAEAKAIAEANRLMRAWLDARKVRSLLHDAMCTLLFSARSPIRLHIPPGLLKEQPDASGQAQTVVVATTIEQALGMIYPDHPTPEHAAVVQDEDTKMEAGVRIFLDESDESDTDDAAVGATGNRTDDTGEQAIELVFVAPDGRTVVRLLSEDDEADDAREFLFQFGGRSTMMEMRRDPLITPQVAQNQRALNLALSMLPRSVITGGFLERVLLNAQMPGHYEKDPDGIKTDRFIPDPLYFGPGTTNMFAGIEQKSDLGAKTFATPDVKWRDPVPVDAPVKAASEHYLAILDETSQLHVVLSGDNQVSGKSREQARAEYLNSLLDSKPEAEAALRFLLETPLAMAEAIVGTPGALTSLVRVEVQCRLDTGPLSPEERAANETSVGKTLSQETAMARNGVDDVDAEKARMASDPLSRATLLKAQGDALTAATTAGLSIATAAEMLGVDKAVAEKIAHDVATGGFEPPLKPAADKAKPEPAPVKDQTQPTGGAGSAAGGTA